VLLEAGNTQVTERDPTGHAEMNLIRLASRRLDPAALATCTLYASAEPCPMCAGAIQQARVTRLVFGAPDQKVGSAGTVVNPLQDPRLLHRVEVQGGVLAADSLALLRRFFDERR
jgi:tRNA(adenine34) deaminase